MGFERSGEIVTDEIVDILLIDDQVDMQEIIADFLRNNGMRVEAYASGEQALSRMDKKTFDLVITDLIMPKMDGFTFLAEVKERSVMDMPVIIMMSGGCKKKEFNESLVAARKEGCLFMKKPFSRDQLLDTVERALYLKEFQSPLESFPP